MNHPSNFPQPWRVSCDVSWCRKVHYTAPNMTAAAEASIAHWEKDHPRRLAANRRKPASPFHATRTRKN